MPKPTIVVGPVHFDDYDGIQFERLAFAYHVRTEPRYSFEWYGQPGKDKGRDIIGTGLTADNSRQIFAVACANWGKLTLAKVTSDFNSIRKSPHANVRRYRVVTRSTIPADLRDKIRAFIYNAGVPRVEIWSGADFEEHLRASTQSLLKRFCDGVEFPDTVPELIAVSREAPYGDDAEVLELLAKAFDRPAFQVHIWQESSLPAFRSAIDDTIRAINTGVWQTREGAEIARLPSKHEVRDGAARSTLGEVVRALDVVRRTFDDGIKRGGIRPIGAGFDGDTMFEIHGHVAMRLQEERARVLQLFDAAAAQVGAAVSVCNSGADY